MKNFISRLTAAFLALLLLTGCTVIGGSTDNDKVDPTLYCTIYESEVPDFTFTHIYGNESEQQTWFWANCDMTNAAIIAIEYDEDYSAAGLGEVLYSFGEVASGDGILLYMEMPEGFPLYAISYTVDGVTRSYAMGYSGLDGSTTLTAIEELFGA